ncbi:uncharacterized protein PV06_02888 [Exophiala oligosperma]|uniref:ASST-domain-containing protein n=1 Tax=Exophiala oligosperma TaxID=215243 RepID=A0A0D2C3S5_9EURO|nr:uncharacterized protein PV06_02888 [Exophiala oligosperma]KIW44417.1 hypothetical protein PV06_02888 [Exophiala oligosperma]
MGLTQLIILSLIQVSWATALPTGQQTSSTPLLCSTDSRQIAVNASNNATWPWQTYRSSTAQPPALLINKTGDPLYDGLIIFATENGGTPAAEQESPYIFNDEGELVWSGPVDITYNVRIQTLNSAPVLTYWSGQGTAGEAAIAGHGYGKFIILDTSYNVIHTVSTNLNITLPPGVVTKSALDLHESYITPRNTLLVSAYNTTPADLSSIGGPKNGWVLDSLAVELNITTGEVLFSWSSLDHLPLNKSKEPLGHSGSNATAPYDFFHINAIQPVGDNYLINSRHYWASFLVNPKGKVLWELNGYDGGDFGNLPEGGTFSWQHFARLQEINSSAALIHWFANNNALALDAPIPSTGLTLQVTIPPNKASPPKLITNFTNPQNPVAAYSQGSFSYLPNGNGFLAYGSNAVLAEYGPVSETNSTEGQVRWSAQLGYGESLSVYRGYKSVWHATPSTEPSLVVLSAKDVQNDDLALCAGTSTMRGFVSWNGATDVTDWIVYTGSNNTTLTAVGRVNKAGFETQFAIPAGAAFVQIGAVENNSNFVARRSSIVKIGGSS